MTGKRIERRLEPRVALRLPICIGGTDKSGGRFEFRTHSANLCRGGLALTTRHHFELGAQVEITIHQAVRLRNHQEPFSTLGRVAHIHINEDTGEAIVGIHFVERLFNRVFTPEITGA